MLAPRWRKVIGDLVSNKTRTLLVVLSIAIGVFAIGMVSGGRAILMRDLNGDWNAVNPGSASIMTEQVDEALVQVIRRMPGIADAQATRSVSLRAQSATGEWKDLQLHVVAKPEDLRMYVPTPLSGAWPPERRSVVLERAALPWLGVAEGDTLLLELRNGKRHELVIGGTVYNLGSGFPTSMANIGYGYINDRTALMLGASPYASALDIQVAENQYDEEHIRTIVSQVEAQIERSGRTTYGAMINKPGVYPADDFVQAFTLLLTIIGSFALLLSGFLVINTVSALLTQQMRQIGVMKSLGARTIDIVQLYLVTVLAFGLLSLLIAIPLGTLGAWALAAFFAALFNFDIATVVPTPAVLSQQIAAGLIIPLLAALVPVISGTRVSVREAIGGPGLGKGRFGRSLIDRLLERIHFLSRPMLLSLRNTFRRKVRLLITLSTLTLAGLVFMAVLSERASLNATMDQVFEQIDTDVFIFMGRPYRTTMLDQVANIPDVTAVEYWNSYTGRVFDAAGRESTKTYQIHAGPAETQMFHVAMSEGRWLHPDDYGAVVLSSDYLVDYPDVQVGDTVRIKANGRELDLQVVGLSRKPFPMAALYVNLPTFSRQMDDTGQASEIRILTSLRDPAMQERVASEAEALLKSQGLEVSLARTLTMFRQQSNIGIDMVIYFLLMMAMLLAAVGGLGLMGTMSINVMERTREIGVMRAIGAGNWAIQRIVIVEGLLIGIISWIIGTILALPVSYAMHTGLEAIFQGDGAFTFVFSIPGVLLWLVIVLFLASVSSFLPAWNASRVTVRDVLAYE
ncbi:MAG: FtsX-like permease family protein [Candidatus Viridilinea halotolerans]|uniref:FtsX-like permease family protein n=1 Tax=Candidatus Viridilinea halotolerans TaxID=2491704 RepID=A0A426TV63_9CHLR|nr:MAG: FtsX-like permease family protein [Candidatus Viridilinea halotolerans]